MKSTLNCLLFAVGALLLFSCMVDAWNRQLFNRYSRNLSRNRGDVRNAATAGHNEINDLNALFGIGHATNYNARTSIGVGGGVGVGGGRADLLDNDDGVGGVLGNQQQSEVYGIVEPLIEDTPCAERQCNVNADCCPSGVCVSTYGEGKCIYVYGRKRDLCHGDSGCEPGMACLKGIAGNFVCQATSAIVERGVGTGSGGVATAGLPNTNAALELRQFGEDCVSSTDCDVTNGLCCQLQRIHHRVLPKKMCFYIRDPFMCLDILSTPEDDEIRETRRRASFNQRNM